MKRMDNGRLYRLGGRTKKVEVEELWLDPVVCLGTQLVRTPARKAGDQGLNPGSGENFPLKLTTQDLADCYFEN